MPDIVNAYVFDGLTGVRTVPAADKTGSTVPVFLSVRRVPVHPLGNSQLNVGASLLKLLPAL